LSLTQEEEIYIKEIISKYRTIMGVLENADKVLYVLFVAVIALIAFVILKGVWPAFGWFSSILGNYGMWGWVPTLAFILLVIIVGAYIVDLLRKA
jgi:uncharacterized membrane protein